MMINVGKTMPCLPPMTGNGNHSMFIASIYGDDWGMVCESEFTTVLTILSIFSNIGIT